MRKSFLVLGLAGLLAAAGLALAQQPVQIWPPPLTTTRASSTIASTNTFQSVFAAATTSSGSRGRSGCMISNNASTTLFVFVGPIASATTPTSLSLAQNGSFMCSLGAGAVMQDQISVTGTTGASFFAISD